MSITESGLKLRCALSDCRAAIITTTAAVTAGVFAKVQDTVLVYAETVATANIGDKVTGIYNAPKIMAPCAAVTSGGFAQFAKVYFNASTAKVTETASGNTLCGTVIEQPAVGDTSVLIDFDGRMGIVS